MNLRRNGRRNKSNWFRPEQRAELLEAFKQRKGTIAEFARQHRIGVSTVHQWMRRAKSGGGRAQPRPRLKFEEVALWPASIPPWAGEVQLPDGTQLRWNGQAQMSSLQELLQQLRRPC